MMKREKGFRFSKETLRNLTVAVLERDLAAVAAGTAPGTLSHANSWPCCPPDARVVQPQSRRKSRGQQK